MTDKDETDSVESDPQRAAQLSDSVDGILDMIDELLEENAEPFDPSYVQKGGQGWSTFVDPGFFVGAATAGIVASATYDSFKTVLAKVVHRLNKIPGPVEIHVYNPDGSIDRDFENSLTEAWQTAEKLLKGKVAHHTIDEANALHWALFVREFLKTEPLIRLDPMQFERLRKAGESRPEKLNPDQMARLIVSQWFARNPNADIGLWE